MKHYRLLIITLFGVAAFSACKDQAEEKPEEIISTTTQATNEAHQIVIDMVDAMGGKDKLYAMKDVEYEYSYHLLTNNKKDVTLERYIFDNEISWATFKTRELSFPNLDGDIIQLYDGHSTKVALNGELIDDEDVVSRSDFVRKTNYYWLIMMYKLLDEGISYEKLPDQQVDSTVYQRVKISYGEGVGDVQDTYVLYINPETKLVDQFLFTVMDFNVSTPLLMVVEYEEIDGLKFMTHRKYKTSNWEGDSLNVVWAADVYSRNIKLNNGFTLDDLSI